MNSQARVRSHFDKDAVRFDAIYEERKPFHQRVVDRLFRGVVLERFRLVRNIAPAAGDWSLLDVGCGSGRYGVALIRDGARRAVGIDLAPKMIELARRDAAAAGIADRCEFHVSEFLEFPTEERFDLILGMGYFDYLRDPLPHLARMVKLSRGKVVASFPKRWEFRAPSRKLRFLVQGGYVRFYSRGEVERLVRDAGIAPEHASLIDLGRDLILIAAPR